MLTFKTPLSAMEIAASFETDDSTIKVAQRSMISGISSSSSLSRSLLNTTSNSNFSVGATLPSTSSIVKCYAR